MTKRTLKDFLKETPKTLSLQEQLYQNIKSDKFQPHSSFLLCPPYSLTNDDANNSWIKELPEAERKIDVQKALMQWLDLYNCLASESLVYLLPPKFGLQDQTYVANLGICLPHTEENDVVISNFSSPPRVLESGVGEEFFNMMGYKVIKCPFKFEGEADLKYMKDNIYIGGHGIRTEKKALDWFKKEFNMEILPVHMTDDYLYHLDCSVFPMNTENVMLCTKVMDPADVKRIEKKFNVVDIDANSAYYGITNSVRNGAIIYSHSNLKTLKYNDEHYDPERKKVDLMSKACEKLGFEPFFIDISEFTKSGALMSCLVMHINFVDFAYSNV